jgi:hypothetical protein
VLSHVSRSQRCEGERTGPDRRSFRGQKGATKIVNNTIQYKEFEDCQGKERSGLAGLEDEHNCIACAVGSGEAARRTKRRRRWRWGSWVSASWGRQWRPTSSATASASLSGTGPSPRYFLLLDPNPITSDSTPSMRELRCRHRFLSRSYFPGSARSSSRWALPSERRPPPSSPRATTPSPCSPTPLLLYQLRCDASDFFPGPLSAESFNFFLNGCAFVAFHRLSWIRMACSSRLGEGKAM